MSRKKPVRMTFRFLDLSKLDKKYPDECVAIYEEKVIDHDKKFENLTKRIDREHSEKRVTYYLTLPTETIYPSPIS